MKKQTFQAALSATARIACCAVLISCQKQSPPTKEDVPQVQEKTTQEQVVESKNEEVAPPQEVMPKNPIDGEASLKMSEEYVACHSSISVAKKVWKEGIEDKPSSNEVKDCCSLQLQELEAKNASPFQWEHYGYCCSTLDFGPRACTPWGPPMPPSFA